jgi:hypothetical protein
MAEVYGDIFWTLESGMPYVVGVEIFCDVYVVNPTDEDRNYMLMAVVSRGEATLVTFPVTVNGQSWFPVPAQDIVTLPGTFTVDYTDVAFTLQLTEEETGLVVSSISSALTSSGTERYPILPGLPGQVPSTTPTTDVLSLMLPILMLGMVGMMIASAAKGGKKR